MSYRRAIGCQPYLGKVCEGAGAVLRADRHLFVASLSCLSSQCLRASPVTSLTSFVFNGRYSCLRRIKSESRRPRRIVPPPRPLPPLRSPLVSLVSFSAPLRLGGEFCVGQLPRSIKADGGRLKGSVVTSSNPCVFISRYSCLRRIKGESRRLRPVYSHLCALRLLCALRCSSLFLLSVSASPR